MNILEIYTAKQAGLVDTEVEENIVWMSSSLLGKNYPEQPYLMILIEIIDAAQGIFKIRKFCPARTEFRIIPYYNNKVHGKVLTFDNHLNKIAETDYYDNKLHGFHQQWRADKLILNEVYFNGQYVGTSVMFTINPKSINISVDVADKSAISSTDEEKDDGDE